MTDKIQIHPSAVVDEKAVLADGVEVGPFCIIGKNVQIGRNTKLLSNVVIEETEIGENCTVYPFTSIGLPPQDIKYKGEKTRARIGDNNIIREYITIHRGSVDGDGFTEIGSDNFFMAYVHIAHDCKVGSNIIMANAVTLAGHSRIEDFAVLGGLVAVHQFTRVGAYSMIGGVSAVTRDIPPYTTASSPRAKLYGLNSVGLKRHGFSSDTIKDLKSVYKILFRSNLKFSDALQKVRSEIKQSDEIDYLIEFLEKNQRAICR